MQLQDRVALVTGAGSGIGEAAAHRFARAGAQVAVLGRTNDETVETCRAIDRNGGRVMSVTADISVPEQMEKAIREIDDLWGRIDIVFANAGINGVWAPIDELAPEEWDETIRINLNGTFFTIKYAVPLLKKQGGSVIITSSINGTRVFSSTGATAYSCTKAAQVAMAKMLALELAKYRIRVNVICPGAIKTSIDKNTERRDLEKEREPVEFPEGNIPLTDGEPGTSEQVAELALFLGSDASSHITGTEVWIDGGQSLLVG